jgi:putative transport protein
MLETGTLFPRLAQNPILVLFLLLGLGLIVGRIKIAGVELGSVTGVLFVGLLVGHLELPVPVASHNIGFVIFIYAVGVQAGPRFIGAFRTDGARYIVLALITAVTATALAAWLASALGFEPGIAAGLLAGALTSTPTLVAAQDAVSQGVRMTGGLGRDQVLGNISAGYAITYLFGMAGLILFVNFLPKLFRIDVAYEAHDYGEKTGLRETGVSKRFEQPAIRAYRVEKDQLVGARYDERFLELPFEIQRVKRDGETLTPDEDFELQGGDIVALIGPPWIHDKAREVIGPEVLDDDVLDRSVETRRIIVSNRKIHGRSLRELDLTKTHHCWLTRVSRVEMDLPRRADLELHVGDALMLTGARSNLDALAEMLGHSDVRLEQTDLVTFAFGIGLGLLVGVPTVALGGMSIGLGMAGGVLLAGLAVGLLNTYRPDVGRMPYPARHVLMELGLLLFMAQIGVEAGANIVETFAEVGLGLAVCGVAVTIVPVTLTFLVGRHLLKMNAAILLGAITGSMTSTAALKQINSQAASTVPTLGYVGAYTFANVLLTIAGALIMRF